MPEPTVDIAAAFELGTPIDDAMQAAFQEAVRQHHRAGLPLVVWRNGKIEHVPAEQFLKNAAPVPAATPEY